MAKVPQVDWELLNKMEQYMLPKAYQEMEETVIAEHDGALHMMEYDDFDRGEN